MLPRTVASPANDSPLTPQPLAPPSTPRTVPRKRARRCPLALLLVMFLPHSAGAWTQTQFVLGTFWDPCLHCYYYGCIGPDPCKDCPFYNCDPADPVNRAGDIARFQR